MNSLMIDLIFVIFFIFMAYLGYQKGFITRLYDIMTTIIVLMISYKITPVISRAFPIYVIEADDVIATIVSGLINSCLIFAIVSIILMIVKKLLGLLVKPVLKSICDHLKLTGSLDHFLGIVLSLIEGMIFAYLIVLYIALPIYPQGKSMVDQSILGKQILNIVPSVAQNLDVLSLPEDSSELSQEAIVKGTLFAFDQGFVNSEDALDMIGREYLHSLHIELSEDQYQELKDLLQTEFSQKEIHQIMKEINVSE